MGAGDLWIVIQHSVCLLLVKLATSPRSMTIVQNADSKNGRPSRACTADRKLSTHSLLTSCCRCCICSGVSCFLVGTSASLLEASCTNASPLAAALCTPSSADSLVICRMCRSQGVASDLILVERTLQRQSSRMAPKGHMHYAQLRKWRPPEPDGERDLQAALSGLKPAEPQASGGWRCTAAQQTALVVY